jgi:ankyrin repeat protein
MALLLGGKSPERTKDPSSDSAFLDAVKNGKDTQRTKDSSSDNVLLDAIKSGDENLVRELLRPGLASLRAKDLDGQTTLHLAVCNDHKSIVSLLLDKGADTEADQNSGEKPGYVSAGGETLSYLRLSMVFP